MASMIDMVGVAILVFLVGASLLFLKPPRRKNAPWEQRLSKGLSKSHREFWQRVSALYTHKKNIDTEMVDTIEELLYGADMGSGMVQEIMMTLKDKVAKGEGLDRDQLKSFLHRFFTSKMEDIQKNIDKHLLTFSKGQNPTVVMIVGVNGSGKTTTVGKLASRYKAQGAKVIVGACDTFRAAAVEQLQIWCKRSGVEMIRGQEKARASGVGYETLQRAKRDGFDYCLLDTAGRFHTAGNLMAELAKCKNVLKKLDPNAPHHILLVIDATVGQNAVKQAREFHRVLGLTGLVVTKCDGSSKAGGLVGIVNSLKIPITHIGVGEGARDLDAFYLKDYLKALLESPPTIDNHSSPV